MRSFVFSTLIIIFSNLQDNKKGNLQNTAMIYYMRIIFKWNLNKISSIPETVSHWKPQIGIKYSIHIFSVYIQSHINFRFDQCFHTYKQIAKTGFNTGSKINVHVISTSLFSEVTIIGKEVCIHKCPEDPAGRINFVLWSSVPYLNTFRLFSW